MKLHCILFYQTQTECVTDPKCMKLTLSESGVILRLSLLHLNVLFFIYTMVWVNT